MNEVTSRWLDQFVLGTTLLAVGLAAVTAWSRYAAPFLQDRPTRIADWESLAALGHREGPDSAAVVAVVFQDYECPACRRHHATLEDLLARYPDRFAVIYRHWPLRPSGAAREAAIAAVCADRFRQFKTFQERLYSDSDWRVEPTVRLPEIAEELGLAESSEFRACLDDPLATEVVERDVESARSMGASGTPTYVINGRRFRAPPKPDELERMIQRTRSREGK